MLIDKGARINAVDKDNNSALIYGALKGKIESKIGIWSFCAFND